MSKKKTSAGIRPTAVMASLLCVSFCLVCFVSVTWAWLTSSVYSSGNNIGTAVLTIDKTVRTDEGNIYPDAGSGAYTLTAGKTYTAVLTDSGTASTGYCVISAGGITLRTPPIPQGTSYTFTITAAGGSDTALTISDSWGGSSTLTTIENGAITVQ